jgi:hypothetical protein
MRRGLAGVLFFIAAICLALAASGWWLQRVAFDTSTSGELADVVLEDPEIRVEIATAAAGAAAATIGVPASDLQTQIDQYAQLDEGADLMSQIVVDSHAKLIGLHDGPVQITGQQLVPIVRHEAVATLPPVVLPVEEVTALRIARTALDWAVPIAAIAGGLALLIGLIAHPQRADAVFGIGMFGIAAAVAVVLLGYVVPVHVVPAVDDSTWTGVIPAVAEHYLPFIVVVAAILVIGGLALMIGSAAARRRRAWSAPIQISRYGDQRRWS